jgi:hypothetical protein
MVRPANGGTRLPIGLSNPVQKIYRNFQFAKGKSQGYSFAIRACEACPMSAFLGFT